MPASASRVSFTRLTQSLGRNGVLKTSGINMFRLDQGIIELTPVTSRGDLARCHIEIPVEDARAVAQSLLGMFD